MKRLYLGCVSALALASSPAAANDPLPRIGPAPAWVEAVAIPAPDKAKADQPLQFLVNSSQLRLDPKGSESYIEMVALPQTVVGLQAVGNVQIPWNVERTDLVIHRVAIVRGDKTIDLLTAKDMLVLRRESNLEKAQLDGVRTVVLPARGLQVGDKLVMAMTYRMKPSSFASQPEEWATQTIPFMFNKVDRRFIVPDGLDVKWYRSSGVTAPVVKKTAFGTEHLYSAIGTKEREWPVATPARFKAEQLQLSAWRNWSDVSASMIPIYDSARKLPKDSALAIEADKIAALPGDPGTKMVAALRLAQEQVRYVALLLGEGAYVPVPAEENWSRRFGDCKGKTVLLLALLDRLGIEAEPMLVSTGLDDSLGSLLPGLLPFDHVIVRARSGGNTYYLDATDYGQRTSDELKRTSFRHGLPIRASATLEELKWTAPSEPLRETLLEWDGSSGFETKVPFTASMVLRGEAATYMRSRKLAAATPEKFVEELENLLPGVSNDALEIVGEEPEHADGSYRVRYSGSAKMDWSPVDGMKGYRYELDQSPVKWDASYGRSKDADRTLPVELNYPYYQKSTEIIRLPKGGKGFKVDGPPIATTLTAADVRRTVNIVGDRAVATSTFRYTRREITPDEARTAEGGVTAINQSFAYVVAPGRIRPAAETK